MKRLEKINSIKFQSFEKSRISDIAGIIGGAKQVETNKNGYLVDDYSYDNNGTSDSCWTYCSDGDTATVQGGQCR